MDPDALFDALVEPIRRDTSSGAAELCAAAAGVLRDAAGRVPADSPEELRTALAELCRRVVAAQPAMAPLTSLARAVIDALDGAGTVDAARRSAALAAERFGASLDERRGRVAAHASRLLADAGRVATLSASSTVRAGLIAAGTAPGRVGPLRVLCFESRPLNEGRALAVALAGAGLAVEYAIDAAAHALVGECDAVVIGADAIGDGGVVAKIGSLALATAAAGAGVPLHVFADETKVLPRGRAPHLLDDRPAGEVWHAPGGIAVWNRYFELVPGTLVASFVTEHGALSPEEIEARR